MKIKDLFKQMEKANEFAEMVGGYKYVMSISIDGDYDKEFSTFNAFFRWVKKEYAKWFVPCLFEQELSFNEIGTIDHHFKCPLPRCLGDELFDGSIYIAFYQRG